MQAEIPTYGFVRQRDIRAPRPRFARLVACLSLALGITASFSPSALAAGANDVTCTDHSVHVALYQGQPADSYIYGELCATPWELATGATVQLLLHPGNTNHSNWDFGTIDGISYSYARDVAALGYPTFAVDELGAGESTHPLSSEVDLTMAAFTIHQVVKGLLNGSITGTRFGKVIAVGQDTGTFQAWQEEINYADLSGIIAAGILHNHLSAALVNYFEQDWHPANQDPKFAGSSGFDCPSFPASCYITTRPGTRIMLYNQSNVDPNVIAADDNETAVSAQTFDSEQGKDDFPTGEVPGFDALSTGMQTQGINVPVLEVMGSANIACGPDFVGVSVNCASPSALVQWESPYYSTGAHLAACSVPNGDQFLTLDLNHWIFEGDAVAWSYDFVGQSALKVQPTGNTQSSTVPGCTFRIS